MKLKLEWANPIPLEDARPTDDLIYKIQENRVPDVPGVYVFGRTFGNAFEALYVGEGTNIRRRILYHLTHELQLMLHIKHARKGKRVLLPGKFIPDRGQQEHKCLLILEKALIRYFLSEGHDLVNKQGTRRRRHEIRSINQKKRVPKLMFVDRGKDE